MQRRIITTTLQTAALIACMTAGWHTIPLAIILGIWVAGFRIVEDQLTLTDRDLKKLLRG